MKRMIFFLLFMMPLSIWTKENLHSLSQQAEAFLEARDYAAAAQVYESLDLQNLLPWQIPRIEYNLGTIALAEQEAWAALNRLQKVNPIDLSLPRFGRNLLINLGIAYWQYAQSLEISHPWPSLNQQALFIEQSLNALNQAKNLDCELQKIEEDKTVSQCVSDLMIRQWTKIAGLQMHAIRIKQRLNWIEQASVETLASFLKINLDELKRNLLAFKKNSSDASQPAFNSFFEHQLDSFFEIWKTLQNKTNASDKKIPYSQAVSYYLNARDAIAKNDLTTVIKELNQTIEALAPLTFQKNKDVRQTLLNFEILMLQENSDTSALKHILDEFNELNIDINQNQSLNQIKENLRLSIKERELNHLYKARIFLLESFRLSKSLIDEKDLSSIKILKQALEQACMALEIFLLSGLIEESSPKKSDLLPIAIKQQQAVSAQAMHFIPAVLYEQKASFQNTQNPSLCLQALWEQVIPLFDQGLESTKNAEDAMKSADGKAEQIVAEQRNTLSQWQQALNLLENPPKQTQAKPSESPSSNATAPQNLSETFRLIQEMYLEDQAPPEKKIGEMHSW